MPDPSPSIAMKYVILFLVIISMQTSIIQGEDLEIKLKESNLFPNAADSRLEIIQHPLKWLPGGCLATKRSPNGAYMWVKAIDEETELVVVYIELGDGKLRKVDEYTYKEKDIPILSQPVGVEVSGDMISYYSGGNPTNQPRVLFERKCRPFK
jgi:hypothetical protein